MNELQIFNHPDFGQIRTVTINDEPWFVGKDVSSALGYIDSNHSILDHVQIEDRVNSKTQGQNAPELGQRGGWLINESGLYSLILSSKLPSAKKFKRWVTSEVLPSIRKHGAYMTPETLQAAILNPDTMIELCRRLKEEQERATALQEENTSMRPKALFADSVAASGSTILVGELAKILRQNGVDMGEKRLFGWMRENGYLIKRKGTDYNMPTQKSMEQGLFKIKETVISHSDGHTSVNKTPKITGIGQQFFVNLFLNNV